MRIVVLCFIATLWLQCKPSGRENSITDSLESKALFESIELENKEYLGKIKTEQNEWFIIAGRSCKDCDENTSIYLFSKNDFIGSDSIKHTRYSYPGKLYSFDDKIIFESRTFYGECFFGLEKVIVWIQKYRLNDGKWEESIYIVELQDKSINARTIHKNILENILVRVNESKCYEIKGRDQTVEP